MPWTGWCCIGPYPNGTPCRVTVTGFLFGLRACSVLFNPKAQGFALDTGEALLTLGAPFDAMPCLPASTRPTGRVVQVQDVPPVQAAGLVALDAVPVEQSICHQCGRVGRPNATRLQGTEKLDARVIHGRTPIARRNARNAHQQRARLRRNCLCVLLSMTAPVAFFGGFFVLAMRGDVCGVALSRAPRKF